MEIKPNANIATSIINSTNGNIIQFPSQKELDLTLANYARENHQLIQRVRKANEYSESISFKTVLAKALIKHQPVVKNAISILLLASTIIGMTYMFVDAFFVL